MSMLESPLKSAEQSCGAVTVVAAHEPQDWSTINRSLMSTTLSWLRSAVRRDAAAGSAAENEATDRSASVTVRVELNTPVTLSMAEVRRGLVRSASLP